MIANSHYVQCAYLERFASSGKVFRYCTLVEHSNVHLWKQYSPRALAYFTHLYTSVESGLESDFVEKWLAREIEEPANRVIDKALASAQLSRENWSSLIRYVAAQDVRTPAYLSKCLAGHNLIVPKILGDSLNDLKDALKSETIDLSHFGTDDASEALHTSFPLQTFIVDNGDGTATVQAEILGGRSLWLCELQRLLTSTWRILKKHRWTILRAPDPIKWFTSDDPVIKLHTRVDGSYHFRGGWDSPSTEIFMPLDPSHLIYASCGRKPPPRGHILSVQQALRIRNLIAEHAHREIYASHKVPDIALVRPRIVNAKAFKAEQDAKREFHESQTNAEWEMLTRPFKRAE